jgi:beta-galactosidase
MTKVETTGQATKVTLSTDKTILLADGKDATVVTISLEDEKGRAVPDANNLIEFALSGNATIIGVGNGDPSSHEPDKCMEVAWKRSAFNGKCQVIIQSGKNKGTIKLEAKSSGLQSASATFIVQ